MSGLVRAQSIGPSTLNAAGGSATIGSATHEFSIGEMVAVHTATGANIIVTQGILQPISRTSGLTDQQFFNQFLNIYPNPSEDLVYFQPSFTSKGILSYQLFDITGKPMMDGRFVLSSGREKQQISLDRFAAGSYMLNLSFEQGGTLYKTTYKLQKIN